MRIDVARIACAAWVAAMAALPFTVWARDGHDPAAVKAVLVAGDDSIPVFDDATASVADWLRSRGVPDANIVRLSAARDVAARDGLSLATVRNVRSAISRMKPAPGGSCFVFATSHGGRGEGLYLSASDDFLSPSSLAASLRAGCGRVPAVVILSACYSGLYVHSAVARADDIVLTAARPDRSSFGCEAGRQYTVYDSCLLDALDTSPTWIVVASRVDQCIRREERREDYSPPSEPQTHFGKQVADLPLP